MENESSPWEAPAQAPACDLWGRQVRDAGGRRLGTIDSVVRTVQGPVRAVVRTGDRARRFMLIDISAAVFQGEAVVVQSAEPAYPDAVPSVASMLMGGWPGGARREA